jgi:uncharacterized protein YgbK (DUF1537 family)
VKRARRPLVGFYGDDFTGSVSNLAEFWRHGLDARLFLKTDNTEAIVAQSKTLDVAGIAGIARSLAPPEMERELTAAFGILHSLDAGLIQYKICSTFDSSPTLGSFGVAIAAARKFWPDCALPVLAATPRFGRYTAFSNHFALENGPVRLDRSRMANHPATPMREADLRLHLQAQTELPVSAVTLLDIAAADENAVKATLAKGGPVIFDSVYQEDVCKVAELIWNAASDMRIVAIAAQGFADGLGSVLACEGALPRSSQELRRVDRTLVLSGSCSPVTMRQLESAAQAGWEMIKLPLSVLQGEGTDASSVASEARNALQDGRSVAIYTAGKADEVNQALVSSEELGAVYARLLEAIVPTTRLQRVILAGGDSSSHTLTCTDANALDLVEYDEVGGGHICKLLSEKKWIDGLEVVVKGGQVGDADLFPRNVRKT